MNDKIRAVIIDDEETAIDNLCFELKKYPSELCRGNSAVMERPESVCLEKERPGFVISGCRTSGYVRNGFGHKSA